MLNNNYRFYFVVFILLKSLLLNSSVAVATVAGAATKAASDFLPEKSCREAWSQLISQNLHKYNFETAEPYAQYQKRVQRTLCRKEWTVLVYMEAENNLNPYAFWDIYEMEAGYKATIDGAGSTVKTDVVVQLNSRGNNGIGRYHIFQSPNIYETQTLDKFQNASEKNIQSPLVQKLSESDPLTEAQRLNDFLNWGISEYPSENYWVIVWGHGQGWRSLPPIHRASSRVLSVSDVSLGITLPAQIENIENAEHSLSGNALSENTNDELFGGIAYNEQTHDVLDIPSLSKILKKVSQRIGKKIDFYTSDACLMQMIEVTNELSAAVRFISGTNQTQSFLGLPYRRILAELNSGRFNQEHKHMESEDEAYLLARMIPKLTLQSYNPIHGSQGRTDRDFYSWMTASSINAEEQTEILIPALNDLSEVLKKYIKEDALRALDLQFLIQKTPAFPGSTQDLGLFLGLLRLHLQHEREQLLNHISDPNLDPNSTAAAPVNSSVNSAINSTINSSITSTMTTTPTVNKKALATIELLNNKIKSVEDALTRTVMGYAFGSQLGVDQNSNLIGFVPRAISIWLPQSPEEFDTRKSEFLRSTFYKQTHWNQWLEELLFGFELKFKCLKRMLKYHVKFSHPFC